MLPGLLPVCDGAEENCRWSEARRVTAGLALADNDDDSGLNSSGDSLNRMEDEEGR